MGKEPTFGPEGAKIYTKYNEWYAVVKSRALHVMPATNSFVAHDKDTKACVGVWMIQEEKGWML